MNWTSFGLGVLAGIIWTILGLLAIAAVVATADRRDL